VEGTTEARAGGVPGLIYLSRDTGDLVADECSVVRTPG